VLRKVRAMTKKARTKGPLASGVCYEGPLAEPIYLPVTGVWLGAKAEDLVREERILKLPLLLKLYGIDERAPNAWAELAWALACDHVPGMQASRRVRRKRGRKPSWKSGLGQELLREVDALRAEKKIGVKAALQDLQKDKAKGWTKYHLNSLGPRYREAVRAEKMKLKALSAAIAFLDKVFSREISHEELRERFKDMKFGQFKDMKVGQRRN
jgi:hypothetical protein